MFSPRLNIISKNDKYMNKKNRKKNMIKRNTNCWMLPFHKRFIRKEKYALEP